MGWSGNVWFPCLFYRFEDLTFYYISSCVINQSLDLKPGMQLWSSFCTCYTSEIWRRGGGRGVRAAAGMKILRDIFQGIIFSQHDQIILLWNAFLVLIIIWFLVVPSTTLGLKNVASTFVKLFCNNAMTTYLCRAEMHPWDWALHPSLRRRAPKSWQTTNVFFIHEINC